jgi:vitamin B12 transporter
MPGADQMAADYVQWGTRYEGNPDLSPETSNTYEGGIDIDKGGLHASLTYFHTDFDDKIESIYDASGDFMTWKNLGSADIDGLEVESSFDIGTLFGWGWEVRPYGNLVWLTRYEDSDTGETLLYTPDITASYGLMVSDLERFTGRLNFQYHGTERIEDWTSGLYPVPVVDKGGFTVVDLTVSQQVLKTSHMGSLTLRGELRYIFDKDYSYVKSYPMPGRTLFGALRWDF